jgi:hypothetical protein
MRLALFLSCSLAMFAPALHAKDRATPQPYLLFYVSYSHAPGGLVGTLSSNVDFETSEMSKDRLDSVSMHAKLIEKTSAGFRFSWKLVRRTHGEVAADISREEFVAWGQRKRIASIPECTVDVRYSPIPANELNPFGSNQALERTADRRAHLFSMTSTLNPGAQLALVSGRSACSR